jgi:hypothetical protein
MFESSVAEIAKAFRNGGLGEAVATFETLRLRNPRLRIAPTSVERLLPLKHLANDLLY